MSKYVVWLITQVTNRVTDRRSDDMQQKLTEDKSIYLQISQMIETDILRSGNASVSFGELTIDLSGCRSIANNCRIDTSCSFGELQLLIPTCYRVEPLVNTSFAELDVKGHPDPEPVGIIKLDGNVSFGEIQIKYI